MLGNQLLLHKIDVEENANESVQISSNGNATVSGSCGGTSKRKGWKADESLKNLDDNIINIIEAEVRCCTVFI